MSSQSPADDGAGAAALLVAAIVIVAIIGLILFARGQEEQERSGASLPVAAVLMTA